MKKSFLFFFCFILFVPQNSNSQEAADYFKQNCTSCHTIGGGRLAGPDLKDVTKRKDHDWLQKFITDPKTVIDAGDPYAIQLQKDARGAIMPTVPTLTKTKINSILILIEAESKLEKSQFAGIQISDRPFTEFDFKSGEEIFLGAKKLTNGGPACLSCHTVQGIGGFGGGTLAPDLTTVFERYEGRKTLATWLSAPATPTMQSVFKKQPLESTEILSLTAYFQQTLQRNPANTSTARLSFILFGFGGALVVLGIFDVVWNKRFRAVRKPLVEKNKLGK